jgi:hypothetical protein
MEYDDTKMKPVDLKECRIDVDDLPEFSWECAHDECILEYFGFEHLPPENQQMGSLFFDLAEFIIATPKSAERSRVIAKLKDLHDMALGMHPVDECE